MTLSDTHLVLLSAAAQREDGLLAPPTNSNEAGRERLRSQFLKQGLVAASHVHSSSLIGTDRPITA